MMNQGYFFFFHVLFSSLLLESVIPCFSPVNFFPQVQISNFLITTGKIQLRLHRFEVHNFPGPFVPAMLNSFDATL